MCVKPYLYFLVCLGDTVHPCELDLIFTFMDAIAFVLIGLERITLCLFESMLYIQYHDDELSRTILVPGGRLSENFSIMSGSFSNLSYGEEPHLHPLRQSESRHYAHLSQVPKVCLYFVRNLRPALITSSILE